MCSGSGGARFDRWRALGCLLPREVRERVFEPAYSDLVRTWLSEGGRDDENGLPFGLHALGTYVFCVPIAAPRLFVKRGRLTLLSRVCVVSLGLFALLVLIMTNAYEAYPPTGG